MTSTVQTIGIVDRLADIRNELRILDAAIRGLDLEDDDTCGLCEILRRNCKEINEIIGLLYPKKDAA